MATNVPPRATSSSDNAARNIESQPPSLAALADTSMVTKCTYCQNTVSTDVQYKVGAFTWISCILIASFGFFLGCCAIPFCVNSAKDIVHICPDCGEEIGRNSRL